MTFPQQWVNGPPFQLSHMGNLIAYIMIWIIALAGLAFVIWRGRKGGFDRWITQDMLILAIMSILLEVYDNLTSDRFFASIIIHMIPFGDELALKDLPYMFLLMTGIALIRKPGMATALVFLNFILMQLTYFSTNTSINVLDWPYGLYQGLFVDIYFVLRGKQAFAGGVVPTILDGFIIGALRAVPTVTVLMAFLNPFLEGQTTTLAYILLYSLFNLVGNGVEAGLSAPFAIRIARSVNSISAAD